MRERLNALRRRATTGQVRIVHILFGNAAANRFFWVAPRRGNPTWTDVRNRVDWLAGRDKAAASHFVQVSLEQTTNPGVVIGLAHHRLGRAVARDWLAAAVANPESLSPRVEQSMVFAGAVAGAARLLLEPDAVRSFVMWLVDRYDSVPVNLFQAMDTVGYRFASSEGLGAHVAAPNQARHRLVITERLDDRTGIESVLPGAKRVTLLATSDTYGQADVEQFRDALGAGEITVEHVRSRITRFSSEYIKLHEATRDLAIDLTSQLFGEHALIDSAYRPAVELHVADFLFFSAIRLRAVEELLDDEEFDHVVIATNNQRPEGSFVRQLAAIERISVDPRVELVSIARTWVSFRKFWAIAEAMTAGHRSTRATLPPRVPGDVIGRSVADECAAWATLLPAFTGRSSHRNALVVTSDSGTYNRSTAAYVTEISKAFGVAVVQLGSDAETLADLVSTAVDGSAEIQFSRLVTPSRKAGVLRELVADRMAPAFEARRPGPGESRAGRMAWAGADAEWERLCRAVGGFLFQLHTIDAWFGRLAVDGTLPDVVVLTPQRHSAVSAVAAAARMHGVPSVAVEPHIQDANYCRFSKVAADYYGVVSNHFRQQAAQGFGISIDRIQSIGSPRLIAPAHHDRSAARAAARASLRANHGFDLDDGSLLLGFFSQPVSWKGIHAVWRSLLEAARATGSRVLLKPHPEDSPSRLRQYLSVAGSDNVLLLRDDLDTAIDAVDIAITAFSTVGLDAVLRQTPVVVLADGDTAYPIDLGSVLGIPVARSPQALIALIADFNDDPQPFHRRAEQFLADETQFIEGPGPRLTAMLNDAIRRGKDGLRSPSELSDHLFLDGPHPAFLD